jgi:hypothetical protein
MGPDKPDRVTRQAAEVNPAERAVYQLSLISAIASAAG